MSMFRKKGYGCTMTNQRDHFPQGLKEYLHHDKVSPACTKAKAMHYAMPIIAIKQCPAVNESKAFTQTLVFFQSTGATNICGMNNLPGKPKMSLGYQTKWSTRDLSSALLRNRQPRSHDQDCQQSIFDVEVLAFTISTCQIYGNHCSLRHVQWVLWWTARSIVGNFE